LVVVIAILMFITPAATIVSPCHACA